MVYAPQQAHDKHVGGLRPMGVVRKRTTAEDAIEASSNAQEDARKDKSRKLVSLKIYPNEFHSVGILADRLQCPTKGRIDNSPKSENATAHQGQTEVIGIGNGKKEFRSGDGYYPIISSGNGVPFEDYCPDDLGEGQSQ